MPTEWKNKIRKNGKLTISFNAEIFNSKVWSEVAKNAVYEFNNLMKKHHIGIQFCIINEGRPNIRVYLLDGKSTFEYDKKKYELLKKDGSVDDGSINLSGNALSGRAILKFPPSPIFEAFVYLPKSPHHNTPNGYEPVGDGVNLVIAVHEFIHCCGLHNEDHSKNDIFNGYPSMTYDKKGRPALKVSKEGKIAPPLFLEQETISKLRLLWPPINTTIDISKRDTSLSSHSGVLTKRAGMRGGTDPRAHSGKTE